MYLKCHIIKILENSFRNTNCYSWTKLILILIHLKYWYCNSPQLERSCLSHNLCKILPMPSKNLLQHNPHHVLHWSPYFVLPHSTTNHHKYCIYWTIFQAKLITFVIELYHNTFLAKHISYQKSSVFKGRFSFKVKRQGQK